MAVGFITNCFIGFLAYLGLSAMTRMRRIDKAMVAGYYGSDSAGTFVTCRACWARFHILYDAYMPVMLAVMEIPGCLVALYLVSRLRHQGMDAPGNMPDEPGYDPGEGPIRDSSLVTVCTAMGTGRSRPAGGGDLTGKDGAQRQERREARERRVPERSKLLHEVFPPGLYLLFGGIIVATSASARQGSDARRRQFSVTLFQGVLCLFLLEMGMTASRKLKDLRTGGIGFIAFGLIAPNVFATLGILVAHAYSLITIPRSSWDHVLFLGFLPCRGFVHRGSGGAADGDPRGEPDAAAGCLLGPYLLIQRDDRYTRLY